MTQDILLAPTQGHAAPDAVMEERQVPRLSIVITANQGATELETTLVSVLENRPDDCEILVALAHPYTDPYHLAGEVEFLDAGERSAWHRLANAGFAASSGEIIHWLSAGARVRDGWADAAIAHFDRDPHVAAVAPLVLDGRDGRQVVSAGVDYQRAGARRNRRRTMAQSSICESNPRPEVVLGPTSIASFFRVQPLLAFDGPFCASVGRNADADLALSLGELGYLAMLEPRSIVHAPAKDASAVRRDTFAAGRADETMFWRHAGPQGWGLSLAAHAMSIALESLAIVVRPARARRLLGRAVAFSGLLGHLRHHGQLMERHRLASDEPPASLRMDTFQPVAAASVARRAA